MMPAFSAPTRSAYVRAAMLGGFAELVAAAGGDAAALAARAGIPERALRDLDMVISWTAVGHLMELAAQDLQKPSLALEWLAAAPAPLLNFGAVALIARFTDTIGEWCFHSRNYWHWHTNGSHAELLDTGANDVLTLRVGFSRLVPPSRHQVEYILGGVCALLRALAPGADEGIERIRFRHVRPHDTRLHEAFFPCPVDYGCAHDELVYRRTLHERPIELHPQVLESWLASYVEARAWTIPDYDGSTRARVEAAIPGLIGTCFCTQPLIARLLSVGAKTLQRQLAREGTTFPVLLDKTRERMARQLLADSEIPVASIAGLLGYTKTPPFTTAVRRWTGMSARPFRNAARSETAGAEQRSLN
ncbi:MAG TPA: AraC family transcriptional regulator ligand-binding domain-containing protein [Aquamicrobium sp.]|nr:AraC family transcriptional regulator ligand-binding domain-containing protein [Aquamicrobium sp.]